MSIPKKDCTLSCLKNVYFFLKAYIHNRLIFLLEPSETIIDRLITVIWSSGFVILNHFFSLATVCVEGASRDDFLSKDFLNIYKHFFEKFLVTPLRWTKKFFGEHTSKVNFFRFLRLFLEQNTLGEIYFF